MAFSLGPAPLGLHAPSDRHTGPPLGPSCFTSRITSPRQAPAHRSPSTRTRWPRPAPFDHYPAPRSTARSPVCRRLITSPPAGRTCPDSDGQDLPARTPLSRLDGPEWRARNRRSRPALRSRFAAASSRPLQPGARAPTRTARTLRPVLHSRGTTAQSGGPRIAAPCPHCGVEHDPNSVRTTVVPSRGGRSTSRRDFYASVTT